MLLGLVYALIASVLFNVGIVLQAYDARATSSALALRWALLGRLFHQPIWLFGWALGTIGLWPQIISYAHAPFVVVQPAQAVGLLLVLVLGARLLHEHVAPKDWAGVVAIITGVVLVAWGAPSHTELHRSWQPVVAVVAALSLAGIVPWLVRHTRLDRGMTLVIACGCGWAATNVATKLLGDDWSSHHYLQAAIWGVIGLANGAVATVTNMTAFQRVAATVVVPVSTAVQTFLPIVVEPFFLQEHWSTATLDGGPMFVGLTIACLGSVLVGGSAAVSGVFARAA